MNEIRSGPTEAQLEQEIFWARFRARKPVITWALIGVNSMIFLLGLFWGAGESAYGLGVLYRMGALVSLSQFHFEVSRLFTAAFLHFSIYHAALNQYSLFVLGSFMERAVGRSRFVVLYIVSALGGSLVTLAALKPGAIAAGASTSNWGLMLGVVFLGVRPGEALPKDVGTRIQRWLWKWVLLNLAISFIPGISMAGHLGGGLTGALLVLSGLLTLGIVKSTTPVMLRDDLYPPGVTPYPVAAPDRRDEAANAWRVIAICFSIAAFIALGIIWSRHEPWRAKPEVEQAS